MDRIKREQLSLKLSDCADAVLMEEDDARIEQLIERTYRDLIREFEGQGRRMRGAREPISRLAPEPALPVVEEGPISFDENANRKFIAGYLDAMVMSCGIIGKHTASRLSLKTFGNGAVNAERWLLSQGLVERTGEGALQITDEGRNYLNKSRDRSRTYGLAPRR